MKEKNERVKERRKELRNLKNLKYKQTMKKVIPIQEIKRKLENN